MTCLVPTCHILIRSLGLVQAGYQAYFYLSRWNFHLNFVSAMLGFKILIGLWFVLLFSRSMENVQEYSSTQDENDTDSISVDQGPEQNSAVDNPQPYVKNWLFIIYFLLGVIPTLCQNNCITKIY